MVYRRCLVWPWAGCGTAGLRCCVHRQPSAPPLLESSDKHLGNVSARCCCCSARQHLHLMFQVTLLSHPIGYVPCHKPVDDGLVLRACNDHTRLVRKSVVSRRHCPGPQVASVWNGTLSSNVTWEAWGSRGAEPIPVGAPSSIYRRPNSLDVRRG